MHVTSRMWEELDIERGPGEDIIASVNKSLFLPKACGVSSVPRSFSSDARVGRWSHLFDTTYFGPAKRHDRCTRIVTVSLWPDQTNPGNCTVPASNANRNAPALDDFVSIGRQCSLVGRGCRVLWYSWHEVFFWIQRHRQQGTQEQTARQFSVPSLLPRVDISSPTAMSLLCESHFRHFTGSFIQRLCNCACFLPPEEYAKRDSFLVH